MIKFKKFCIGFAGLLGIFIIFVIGFFVLQLISFIDFDYKSEETFVEQVKKNIEKKAEQNINVLIIGRGGGNHDAPNLTDTIILANIDSKKNIISMLSIPRDLYVEYEPDYGGKINVIYEIYKKRLGNSEKGIEKLGEKVSQLTGQKIDYYVNVDFKGFEKIIDTFGGVDVNVKETIVDNKYPGKTNYTTFILKKGNWTLDGEVALKYVRSRHSTSDFDRSLRQQEVIKSLKNKIVEAGFFENTSKITQLYDIYSKYLATNIDLATLLKLGYLGKKADKTIILSANLNTSCFYGAPDCSKGGVLYEPERKFFDGMSVSIPIGSDSLSKNDYSQLHKFTDIVFNSQEFFIENYKINIFNSLKINNLASLYSNDLLKYGFNLPKYGALGNTDKIYKESIIYYNNIEDNSKTLEVLKKFFKGNFERTESPKYSKETDTKIEIVLGEDYEEVFDF